MGEKQSSEVDKHGGSTQRQRAARRSSDNGAETPMRYAAPATRNRRFTIASSVGGQSSLGDVVVGRRRSLTYDEASKRQEDQDKGQGQGIPAARRKSLAYADLMAVFYPPSILAQPTITDAPFECQEEEADGGGLGASWEPTLERAIRSIVSIKAQCVRSFDTESSGTYTATGFVVDAARGLILSNRHVVNPGPIVAQAVFVNYEEVSLEPLYRDPIHDFGFFRFDPARLRYMAAEEIRLAPHKARVGMEIRVVGNDAGEKLSILAGTLARLDRQAPEYGMGEYNDFNTFYMQAASGTSGGSSGSPVLDIYGDAVALNAGGSSKAASSFYLPLARVVRALRLLQHDQHVPRGTVQAELEHLPYDELRRLGLPVQLETHARDVFPHAQGLLAVRAALPGGPADGHLRAGDIVVAVDGQPVADFAAVEAATDERVGREICVRVWRGNAAHDARMTVQDLHEITPSRFVEFGGGVINELSYQVARSYSIPLGGGVYVASSGHVLGSAGAWRGSVVTAVGTQATPNLDAFVSAIAALREGARVPLRFFSLDNPHKQRVGIMDVATQWHLQRVATRDLRSGLWRFSDICRDQAQLQSPAGGGDKQQVQNVAYHALPESLAPADRVWRSFVGVEFRAPFLIDGMRSTRFQGPGLVVDGARGLVVCDRDTVPIALGDVRVTIGGSAVLPARVVLLHPVHNFAVVQYDASRIKAPWLADLQVHEKYYSGAQRLEQGDHVCLVAVTGDNTPVVRRTRVAARSMVSTRECAPPRFRCVNAEGVRLDDQPTCLGGVLCDPTDGRVMGLWVSVSSQDSNGKDTTAMLGLEIAVLRVTVDSLRATGNVPVMRSLDVDLWSMRPAAARAMGLSAERIAQAEQGTHAPQLLYVAGLLAAETPAGRLLRTGDVLLECDGRVVNDVRDLAVVSQETVDLVVLRDAQELKLQVPTTALDSMETKRVIHWAGALIQQPYRAVLEQISRLPSSVYIACTLYGSPANCYGLRPGMWVTEIDGRPVEDIDGFLRTLAELGLQQPPSADDALDARYVRITVVNKNMASRVLSLRLDNHYWPPWQLVHDLKGECGWSLRSLHAK
ncbi:hypothetical protein GGI07_005352 [Coemansia sp. Benny D115]|nr:hypothetical protein GGI07_005352 [Coemansia sp. Benny D115]